MYHVTNMEGLGNKGFPSRSYHGPFFGKWVLAISIGPTGIVGHLYPLDVIVALSLPTGNDGGIHPIHWSIPNL